MATATSMHPTRQAPRSADPAALLHALDETAIVAVTDRDGVITHVNDRFCEASQYRRDELLGQTHRIVKSHIHPPAFFRGMWEVILSGRTWHGEFCNRRKDGTLYWVDTTIVPILDSVGRPEQFVSIRFDVTAHKTTENAMDGLRARAMEAEKLALLGHLSAGLAHELRNPVVVAEGWATIIEDHLNSNGQSDLDVAAAVRHIRKAARQLACILNGMKHLSSQREDLPYEEAELGELVEVASSICSYRLRKAQIPLRVKCESGVRLVVQPAKLIQVLTNLIVNSCDAIENRPDKWIEVNSTVHPHHIEIQVTDSGPGIPPDVRAKLFQPFFTTKDLRTGTGLGLSLSRHFVEQQGGELNLDADHPHTRFIITLPRTPPTEMPD